MVIKIALYLELFRYVQFVVKQDKSSLCSSSSQLHIPSRRSSQHSPALACLRARPKPPYCAQVTSSSSFVIACSAGRDRHGSIRHGIVTRNKLMVQRDLQRVLFQENPKIFSLPLRNGMKRLIEIFLLYILCSLTKISV